MKPARASLPADPSRRMLDRKRRADAALLLPLIGAFLFVSPLFTLFGPEPGLFGLPSIFVYVFAVWGALVLMSWWLARALAHDMAEVPGPQGPPGPDPTDPQDPPTIATGPPPGTPAGRAGVDG